MKISGDTEKTSRSKHSAPRNLFAYPKYWAECYGTAPFLPMTRKEMDTLGWDSCDIIIVTGDAYIDHPSFGMAVIGRLLEAQGYRVGIIFQPDWNDPSAFTELGEPNLFFGITAGNMDSLINRYTADLKLRSDDAYTPGNIGGKRPERAVIVYAQKIRALYKNTPLVIGGIEASLRRIAQYDYWSNEVRRSVLIDSDADILLYGNAERAIVELAHQLAMGRDISDITDIRGTAILKSSTSEIVDGSWSEIDSSRIDWPRQMESNPFDNFPSPYEYQHDKKETNHTPVSNDSSHKSCDASNDKNNDVNEERAIRIIPLPLFRKEQRNDQVDAEKSYIRLPSFEKVKNDPALYAHASRILHIESNPGNALPLVQKHGTKEIWINPPPIPLETPELDGVFDLPYQRIPHPAYEGQKIPAYDMIRFSVNIMRGCFGGCTFCSITEHEGRIIQSRSQESILREIENIRDKVPGFTGSISDLGGPTANMYRLNCVSKEIEESCKRLSCVYPTICKNLNTDHKHTTELYRAARKIPGVKNISIASGLRYDLAVRDPEYVKELVTHHVGGYLKIAPEHSEEKTLAHMMKPNMDSYYEFEKMFNKFSKEAGKKQYLIPYFIAAHPGSDNEDMLQLALWLKKNKFRPDQVQTFYPSPMAMATAMYYSGKNPLKKVSYKSPGVNVAKKIEQRRLQKAFLRYHDEKNWPMLREALKAMKREDLIGDKEHQLVPAEKPKGFQRSERNKNTKFKKR